MHTFFSPSHTRTHTDPWIEIPSIQVYTIPGVWCIETESREARREWSHPQGSPSSSRFNATRAG